MACGLFSQVPFWTRSLFGWWVFPMGSVAGEGVLCTTECSPPALPSVMWGDGDHCYYSSVEKGLRGSDRQTEWNGSGYNNDALGAFPEPPFWANSTALINATLASAGSHFIHASTCHQGLMPWQDHTTAPHSCCVSTGTAGWRWVTSSWWSMGSRWWGCPTRTLWLSFAQLLAWSSWWLLARYGQHMLSPLRGVPRVPILKGLCTERAYFFWNAGTCTLLLP